MKRRDITCALAALALGLCASSCSDGDSTGIPVTRAPPPFGTEPSGATGSEPTTGGNDPLPGAETSLPALCSAVCARLESECAGAVGADCTSSCTSSGLSFPGCAIQFQAYLTCLRGAMLLCVGTSPQVQECAQVQAAFGDCINATGT